MMNPVTPPPSPPLLPPSPELLAQLAERLGPRGFVTAADVMQPWLTDWRGKYHGAAPAMLCPANAQEVADIVRLCAEARTALVPQGGNSGMVGGATPDASGHQLLLSLRRMNRIRELDVAGRSVVAEGGVILQNLHAAAEEQGLRFPLTLGGKGSATIGGLISTNAGGTQVLRHGTMRALVDGVEAVLPDGSIVSALAALKKDNRGYDIRHLLCGAEGTLGIVTAARLRLVPAIVHRVTAWAGLAALDSALPLLRQLEADFGAELEGFEIIPQSCVGAVLAHIPATRAPLPAHQGWHVLLELAGQDAGAADRLIAAASDAAGAGLITDMALAKSESEADAWWRIRDAISEAERAQGPALQHDVSVPVDAMPGFVADNPARISQAFPGARTVSFGHLGDGNVHHHVQPPRDADGAAWIAANGAAVSALVYAHVAELGGSLSAEHGIGQAKRDLLVQFSDPARIAMLRGVKAGLDPLGIMNPGKLVP
jgi:FAD/FMN-containing dehydrogenase